MSDLANSLEVLLGTTDKEKLKHKAVFFRLGDKNDRAEFEQLLNLPGIKVSDQLHSQLRELVKSMHPKNKFNSSELDKLAQEHLNNIPSEEYGAWVYYPWLNKLVHILDEEEYRSLRTNRNQFKIMPAERDKLANIKIGVLGLSVGQSVAIALSMERSYGELRIADFDILELSNLNRIRSGVQDLGLLKTVSTARQIAEIDPYLKVKCFHDGLTEENIDEFFLGDGKLDMVIDECDGLDIKILARQKARELEVPVIMETSDRGMIDIERYDLEPKRPLLHGIIDHLEQDPAKLKGLSNEEKVPYILPMVGLETMSDRLKASMLEVEQSVTTWPQLASDVILGGAVAANVCRRIALNELKASGRFFVDMNEIVSPDNAYKFSEEKLKTDKLSEEYDSHTDYKKLKAEFGQIELRKSEIEELVNAAISAPSGGNNQPWKWVYEDKNLYLFIDKRRASSFLDYAASGSYLSLGAATENLILKAHKLTLEVEVERFPDQEQPNLVAVFRFFKKVSDHSKTESHQYDELVNVIDIRLTNRLLRKPKLIVPEKLEKFKNTCKSIVGADVHFLTDRKKMNDLGSLIAKIDRLLITHKLGHHGFINEIRWTPEEAQQSRDGVDLATIDLNAGEAAGFKIAKKWSVVKTLNKWGGGSVFEKLSKKGVESASAMGLITMNNSRVTDFFEAGRALERTWLKANQESCAFQPMTGLTFLLHRLSFGNGEDLSESQVKELQYIKDKLYELYSIPTTQYPIFLFRLLKAEDPKVKSLRRPLNEVLEYK